jgi:hypothetical protein
MLVFLSCNALGSIGIHSLGRSGGLHDPKAQVGRISSVFAKKNPKTGKRRNLGTFSSMAKAKQHEKAVQYFKRAG